MAQSVIKTVIARYKSLQPNDDCIGAMNLHRKGIEQIGVVALEV